MGSLLRLGRRRPLAPSFFVGNREKSAQAQRKKKNKRKLPIVTDAFGIVESRSQRAFFFSNELPHRANTRPSSSFYPNGRTWPYRTRTSTMCGLYESITTKRESSPSCYLHTIDSVMMMMMLFLPTKYKERTVRLLPFYLKMALFFYSFHD